MSDSISEQIEDLAFSAEAHKYADKLSTKEHGRFLKQKAYRDYLTEEGYEYDGEVWEIVSIIPAQPGYENHFKRTEDGVICKEPVPAWLLVETREDRMVKPGKSSPRTVPSFNRYREVVAATLNESRGLEIARDIKNYEGTFRVGYNPLPEDPDRLIDDIYGREW